METSIADERALLEKHLTIVTSTIEAEGKRVLAALEAECKRVLVDFADKINQDFSLAISKEKYLNDELKSQLAELQSVLHKQSTWTADHQTSSTDKALIKAK